eukprot:SAG22_NODE_562_length_9069_cov_9.730212_5_plen_290_part_00
MTSLPIKTKMSQREKKQLAKAMKKSLETEESAAKDLVEAAKPKAQAASMQRGGGGHDWEIESKRIRDEQRLAMEQAKAAEEAATAAAADAAAVADGGDSGGGGGGGGGGGVGGDDFEALRLELMGLKPPQLRRRIKDLAYDDTACAALEKETLLELKEYTLNHGNHSTSASVKASEIARITRRMVELLLRAHSQQRAATVAGNNGRSPGLSEGERRALRQELAALKMPILRRRFKEIADEPGSTIAKEDIQQMMRATNTLARPMSETAQEIIDMIIEDREARALGGAAR